MTAIAGRLGTASPVRLRSIAWGLAAGTALLGLYLVIVTVAQGAAHALELFAADAPFVLAIAAGFGLQIALFVELRAVHAQHRGAAAVTAAGTGTSAAAMLACCAHHLVDLLPLVGLSTVAVFLGAYKTPLFVLGIGMNILGVVIVARQLRAARRACAISPTATPAPGSGGESATTSHEGFTCH